MPEKTTAELIAAARKACAEGEAIVARTREVLNLKERGRDGPKMLAWMRGEIGRGSPPESEPDHFLSDADKANVQAIVTMMALASSTKRGGLLLAIDHDIGIHLHRLRAVDGRDGDVFRDIIALCGLGQKRAYQLMRFARKNLEAESDGSPENETERGGDSG